MRTNFNFLIVVFVLSLGLMSSCQYKNIVEPPITPPNPTDTISFVNKIEPIFNVNSNCTACHKTGATAPDLSTGNAYNSIISMGLVNTSTPENSTIYWHPNSNNATVHAWKKYTAAQAQLVLQWIEQGALNN